MKPFSTNVVFVDTEFTQLAADGEILSIALVKHDGSELYIELDYEGEVSDWVKENVQPYLSGERVSKKEAVKQIWEFLGDTKPYLVAWVPHFDMVMLYQLFGVKDLPVNWFPIDFASMMFGLGLDPEDYRDDRGRPFIKELGIDITKFKTHHALDDARLLREVFVKFSDK